MPQPINPMNEITPFAPVPLSLLDGKPVVLSRTVASYFGKEHKDFLRAIREVLGDQDIAAEVSPEFIACHYLDPTGRTLLEYAMTEEGFMMIALAQTGAKARKIRWEFVKAFRAMRAFISGHGARRVGKMSDLPHSKHSALPRDPRLPVDELFAAIRERFGMDQQLTIFEIAEVAASLGIFPPGCQAVPSPADPKANSSWGKFIRRLEKTEGSRYRLGDRRKMASGVRYRLLKR